MARVTDTRQRVRELAGQLASQGIEPTPSLIRSFLGKGSPNTGVDELRRWKDEQSPAVPSVAAPGVQPPSAQIGSPMPIEKAALQELAVTLAKANQMLATQAEAFGRIGTLER